MHRRKISGGCTNPPPLHGRGLISTFISILTDYYSSQSRTVTVLNHTHDIHMVAFSCTTELAQFTDFDSIIIIFLICSPIPSRDTFPRRLRQCARCGVGFEARCAYDPLFQQPAALCSSRADRSRPSHWVTCYSTAPRVFPCSWLLRERVTLAPPCIPSGCGVSAGNYPSARLIISGSWDDLVLRYAYV